MKIQILAISLLLIILSPVYLSAETDNGKCADFLKTYQPKWEIAENIFYPLEAPIGNTYYIEEITQYLLLVYNFAVSAAGILAVVVIMFGGMNWAMSAGNEQKITAAKETIISAVIGLILALGSYVILNFISPQLVNIDLKILEIPINAGPQCADVDSSLLIDAKNQAVTINDVSVPAGIVSVGKVCKSMQTILNNVAYNLTVYNNTYKQSLTISGSGYRSNLQQWQLRQCYCNSLPGIGSGTCDNTCNGCVNCTACNPAAEPCKPGAKHPLGLAVDVRLVGTVDIPQDDDYNCAPFSPVGTKCTTDMVIVEGWVKAIMEGDTSKNAQFITTGLSHISNEWWHYQFSASSCNAGSNCSPAVKEPDSSCLRYACEKVVDDWGWFCVTPQTHR